MADPNQAATRAQELMESLWNDSTLGPIVRQKAKEKYPDVVLPEDQLEPHFAALRDENKSLSDRLEKIAEERDAEKKAAAESAQSNTLQTALEAARQKFNLTEKGFDDMVAHMKATNNYTDALGAAAYIASQSPPPPSVKSYMGPQNINLFGTSEKNERFELLHRDPTGRVLDAEFQEFFADPDAYVASAGLA